MHGMMIWFHRVSSTSVPFCIQVQHVHDVGDSHLVHPKDKFKNQSTQFNYNPNDCTDYSMVDDVSHVETAPMDW